MPDWPGAPVSRFWGGGDSSMFDSHPGSQARADHIRQRIAADRK